MFLPVSGGDQAGGRGCASEEAGAGGLQVEHRLRREVRCDGGQAGQVGRGLGPRGEGRQTRVAEG